MDKGIIKMVIIVMTIAITLLLGSMCLSMYFGRHMIQSQVDSVQTNQDN